MLKLLLKSRDNNITRRPTDFFWGLCNPFMRIKSTFDNELNL